MRILIVAATLEEIGRLKSEVGGQRVEVGGQKSEIGHQNSEVISRDVEGQGGTLESVSPTSDFRPPTSDIEFLITGVGMVATAFALGRHLVGNKYDLAINLGIAGSFDRNIALGDVAEITEDTFAELGAEDGNIFLPIDKLGFGTGTFHPGTSLSSLPKHSVEVKQVTAITVNTVHGNEAAISKIKERLNPQLESMEGAAFFYACKQFGLPCLQIRAVSNYVEKRNRDNWKIGLAIKNLNNFAADLLKVLC